MTVHVGTTFGRDERDAQRQRRAPVVAAARVVSIDYRPIVENAVSGLGQNTPDARREVYAQAKAVVKRHLQLMRLPDPIVELEKLALDLAIRNIEKRIRIHQSVEDDIREGVAKGDRVPGSLGEALASLAKALAAMGRAFASLTLALCLGPLFRALWILLWPLRMVLRALVSPVGLAAMLPIAAMAIFVGFFVDDDIAYRSLLDGPAVRWLSRLEQLTAAPKLRPSAASPERRQAGLEPAGESGDRSPPSSVTVPALPFPASAGGSSASSGGGTEAPTYRGATKVRPVRADFAAPPAIRAADAVDTPSPPDDASVCDDARSAAERIGCARAFAGQAEPASPQAPPVGSTSVPPLVAGYPAVANLAAPPSRMPPPSEVPPARFEAIALSPTPAPETAAATPAIPIDTTARSMHEPEAVEDEAAAAPIAVPFDAPGASPSARTAAITPLAPAAESETTSAVAQPGGGAIAPTPPLAPAADSKVAALAALVAALMDNGKAAARNGDLDRAVRDFGEAIKLDAKYPESYAERGQALFKMGAFDRAIADFTAAIERDREHGPALRGRGMAYFRRGMPDPALADLNRAIQLADLKRGRLSPTDLFEARRYRIALYAVKQQYDLAIADATALIDSYGRDPALAAALKAAYGDAGAGDAMAAVYRDRATAYIRTPAISLGWKRRLNLDRAAEDLSAAIPLSSDRGFAALLERARLHEDLGEHDPAVVDLKTALGIKPDSDEARSALRRLGVTPPPLANAAAAPAIPMPRPRPAVPLALVPTAG